MFDNPYKGDGKLAEETVHSKAHQAVALQAALESIVLLKNENSVLPLSKSLLSILLSVRMQKRENMISRYGPANARYYRLQGY